jgi:hypothetical protein
VRGANGLSPNTDADELSAALLSPLGTAAAPSPHAARAAEVRRAIERDWAGAAGKWRLSIPALIGKPEGRDIAAAIIVDAAKSV